MQSEIGHKWLLLKSVFVVCKWGNVLFSLLCIVWREGQLCSKRSSLLYEHLQIKVEYKMGRELSKEDL